MVRIEQASNNNGPIMTTGGGFVPSVSGVGPQYLIGNTTVTPITMPPRPAPPPLFFSPL